MIALAKTCPGGTALFTYVIDENKGYELFRNNLSGMTPKEIYSEMKIIQRQNLKCINNTLSIVISPTIEESSKLTNEKLQSLVKEILAEMDLNPTSEQFLAFVHTEKQHKHIHILLNRVQMDGSLFKDYRISKRFQNAAHKVAQSNGLTSARDLKDAKDLERIRITKSIREKIRKAHYVVIRKKPRTITPYQKAMSDYGIDVKPTINKQGNIQGYRFIDMETGVNLKASEVDRNFKLHKLYTSDLSNSKDIHRDLDLNSFKINEEIFRSVISQLNYYNEKEPRRNKKRGRSR